MITRRVFFAFVTGLCGVGTVLAQKKAAAPKGDPFIGSWALDLTRSEFIPGPGPATRNVVVTAIDNGLHFNIHDSGGFIDEHTNYEIFFDGQDHPVDTAINVQAYSTKRVDANTIERTGKIRGMSVETATYKISADGKTMTLTTQGSIRGNDYSSTQVLTKL
jgi:hypothetical protein